MDNNAVWSSTAYDAPDCLGFVWQYNNKQKNQIDPNATNMGQKPNQNPQVIQMDT